MFFICQAASEPRRSLTAYKTRLSYRRSVAAMNKCKIRAAIFRLCDLSNVKREVLHLLRIDAVLEHNAKRYLDGAGGFRGRDHAEIRISKRVAGNVEVRVIEDVEELAAKLGRPALGELKILR